MRVLLSVREDGATSNPYTRLLVDALPDGIDAVRFSYTKAIFGGYDVFHVHWPEYVFRGSSPSKAIAKAIPGIALLFRLWAFRTPVVRTVHNESSHEKPGVLERIQVQLLDRLTTVRLYLNESPQNDLSKGIVVLHARYPRSGQREHQPPRTDRRVLFFGQVRPYKGVEDLIQAFTELCDDTVTLTIAGLPLDDEYSSGLRALAPNGSPIQFRLGHLEQDELDDLIDESDLVVLPYKRMYNSGAVILALGRGTAVSVPESGSTLSLRSEVGRTWVHLFTPPFQSADLANALSHRQARQSAPHLERRDQRAIGALHADVYRIVVSARVWKRRDWRAAALTTLRTTKAVAAHSALNAGPFNTTMTA